MKFISYGRQFIDQDDIDAVSDTLQSDFLTQGPKVEEFEDAISQYCGVKYAVAVANATAGLHLAALATLNEGDKVLTSPNSFLATSNAILYAKAKPIFVDINNDGNIDLDLCEQALIKDSSIKAIFVTAMTGLMVNQKKLKHLKDNYNIKIIEDCAHAIGAKDGSIFAGSCAYSDCTIFSFHPVKLITTGEGGAITTNSKSIYKKLIQLRSHGMVKDESMDPWQYEMHSLGLNYRLTDIQASLGISQLKKLNNFLKKRELIAKKYDESFHKSEINPLYSFNGKSSYHLYVVQVVFDKFSFSKKDLFIAMKKKNIGLQVHYIPINKQPYYKKLGYGSEITPNMDYYYQNSFSIPIFPSLSDKEQKYVINTLQEFVNQG
ncbi:MAG: UDP-4-amino-4,6-dideoxy-N-acetyl-beta-L-altrosamine transaminase [Flavobacteriaceae bacterium]|nr:UDP-4-amino-4,6-dideoxy-N-acetyl-beta-L-altrosamine transaminase [Flavobacteriaceae bacterium]|tara:strand:- start:145 stop:1275 length:1131 start_codon:yes stop_codon:yes gene_type:complete